LKLNALGIMKRAKTSKGDYSGHLRDFRDSNKYDSSQRRNQSN
jgi:hypothetical protein